MDYSFDACQCLNELNLDSVSDLKQILRRDKHTRIEGLCSEAVFAADLLRPSFPIYSTGWWFRRQDDVYRIARLVTDVAELSNLDFGLLDKFARHTPTTVIQFDVTAKACYYVEFKPDAPSEFCASWSSRRKVFPRKSAVRRLPDEKVRNAARLDQALQLLADQHLLRHAAVERLFANCWLGDNAVWDVDFFAEQQGQFIAFEVKQKYPTHKGTFGLNIGEARLLTFLSEIGILPVHVILTKPVSDETVPAIDLYTLDKYRNLSLWIAARFTPAMLSDKLAQAPGKTGIYGDQPLIYYDLALKHFHRLKPYGAEPATALLDFINGKTTTLKGLADIPHTR
jgi:hypothetical protein